MLPSTSKKPGQAGHPRPNLVRSGSIAEVDLLGACQINGGVVTEPWQSANKIPAGPDCDEAGD